MQLTPDAVDMAAFAYARGAAPQAGAVIRRQPQDFQVDECCAVTLSSAGEHLWLAIEKTNLTTPRVARVLAAAAEVPIRDVGYAGLKDRHAVTRQWFSLPWPISRGDEALTLDTRELPPDASMRVLEQGRHTRKLRRGTHEANAFTLTLREVCGDAAAIEADLARMRIHGVPNYFGAQRFGHGGHNLGLARSLFNGKRLRRDKRGFALSAARAYVFNAVLDARVRAANWNTVLPGEAVMLNGSNSVFSAVDEDMDALTERLAACDIHPSGPLPGEDKKPVVAADAAQVEQTVMAAHTELVDGLHNARVQAARRALRLLPRDLAWSWLADDCLQLTFSLPTGGFATSVLREFVSVSEPDWQAGGAGRA